MLLFILAYSAGIFTIISPCILPVLPFIFSRTGMGFWRSHLPMLVSMAASFVLIASLAAVAGEWVVITNHYARLGAIILLGIFGAALVWPRLANWLAKPAVALGARLTSPYKTKASPASSALLGVATGLLWTPCAGPVLGLIMTGAALNGANIQTSLLLLAYAGGAVTSLALALLVGGQILTVMKNSLKISEALKRMAGALVLASVAAIALGLDTSLLARWSLDQTTAIEQRLINEMNAGITNTTAPPTMMMGAPNKNTQTRNALPVEAIAPSFKTTTSWLNSSPLSLETLKGKVVLVDFWTYSCINCLRAIPYVRAWAEKYRDEGLVVIGVHTPEFAFERDIDNVKRAIASQQITYPVAIDNDYAIWRAYQNQYWPAHYFIDAEGQIRHHHFGEGDYERSEQIIQQLLAEAGATNIATGIVSVTASGSEAAPNLRNIRSPETYIGFNRAENFVSAGGLMQDAPKNYTLTENLRLNEWGLVGKWHVSKEHARLVGQEGSIAFRFHARDLHMVLGRGETDEPVRFRVTLDGKPPLDAHGLDVNSQGEGIITQERLYQLIRQPEDMIGSHEFKIEFLGSGVEAYVFTFG